MLGTNILLDPATGDLQIVPQRDGLGLITSGLVIGDAAAQNQAMIVQAQKGEFKEYPTLGVGIWNMLGDHDIIGWKREISVQLEADGMAVDHIELHLNKPLIVDAHYRL